MRRGLLRRASGLLWPVALAASIALSACVTHDAYPPAWSRVDVAALARCTDYQGDYLDVGDSSATDGRPRLSGFLGVATEVRGAGNAGVRLNVDADGRVAVRLLRLTSDGAMRADDLPDRILDCSSGVLQFPPRQPARDSLFIGQQWGQVTWSKAGDGALVLRAASAGAGTVLVVVPVAGSDVTWYRFPALAR